MVLKCAENLAHRQLYMVLYAQRICIGPTSTAARNTACRVQVHGGYILLCDNRRQRYSFPLPFDNRAARFNFNPTPAPRGWRIPFILPTGRRARPTDGSSIRLPRRTFPTRGLHRALLRVQCVGSSCCYRFLSCFALIVLSPYGCLLVPRRTLRLLQAPQRLVAYLLDYVIALPAGRPASGGNRILSINGRTRNLAIRRLLYQHFRPHLALSDVLPW